jgi:hypothetical protein
MEETFKKFIQKYQQTDAVSQQLISQVSSIVIEFCETEYGKNVNWSFLVDTQFFDKLQDDIVQLLNERYTNKFVTSLGYTQNSNFGIFTSLDFNAEYLMSSFMKRLSVVSKFGHEGLNACVINTDEYKMDLFNRIYEDVSSEAMRTINEAYEHEKYIRFGKLERHTYQHTQTQNVIKQNKKRNVDCLVSSAIYERSAFDPSQSQYLNEDNLFEYPTMNDEYFIDNVAFNSYEEL